MENYKKYSTMIVLMVIVINAKAQGLEEIIGFEDGVNDTSSAPINYLILIAIVFGAVLGIKKLNR